MIEEKATRTEIQDQTSEQYGTNEFIAPILVLVQYENEENRT